jgi:hypothetical protein
MKNKIIGVVLTWVLITEFTIFADYIKSLTKFPISFVTCAGLLYIVFKNINLRLALADLKKIKLSPGVGVILILIVVIVRVLDAPFSLEGVDSLIAYIIITIKSVLILIIIFQGFQNPNILKILDLVFYNGLKIIIISSIISAVLFFQPWLPVYECDTSFLKKVIAGNIEYYSYPFCMSLFNVTNDHSLSLFPIARISSVFFEPHFFAMMLSFSYLLYFDRLGLPYRAACLILIVLSQSLFAMAVMVFIKMYCWFRSVVAARNLKSHLQFMALATIAAWFIQERVIFEVIGNRLESESGLSIINQLQALQSRSIFSTFWQSSFDPKVNVDGLVISNISQIVWLSGFFISLFGTTLVYFSMKRNSEMLSLLFILIYCFKGVSVLYTTIPLLLLFGVYSAFLVSSKFNVKNVGD